MEAGTGLIRQYGMKRMSIEELTKKVGIAQGTFYNFFKSKEIFVCEIAGAYQEEIDHQVEEIVRMKGGLDREDVRAFYRKTFLEDESSIFRFLSREDIQTIVSRLPTGYLSQISSGKEAIMKMALKVRGGRASYDIDLIFNWIQILNLVVENKDLLSGKAFEKTINQIIDHLLDEIFEQGRPGKIEGKREI